MANNRDDVELRIAASVEQLRAQLKQVGSEFKGFLSGLQADAAHTS
jgi:hypothetical protein